MSVEGSKVEKSSDEANYMGPEKGPFRCGRCEYYLARGKASGPCAKVKGIVEAKGCCNLFEPEDE